MSWDDVERDWSSLSRDARRVIDDARAVGRDLEHQAELAGDEAVAAEYLATESAVEWLAGWFEDAQELTALGGRQWRHAFGDGVTSLRAVARARGPRDLAMVPADHVRRRVDHVREGCEEAGLLARRSLRRAWQPLGAPWKPLLRMIRADWG